MAVRGMADVHDQAKQNNDFGMRSDTNLISAMENGTRWQE